MQVANALNNSIRILFNPRVEPFKLFDFLMVKTGDDRYLAQIMEIYDDKFDSSQNVAKLKLFYKITQNNEVMPYDNFTPNKECEIIKVKQEEVENFINNDKKTFILGTNAKTSSSLNIQYDFFKNSVILADKVEQANAISLNLAKNLSADKNVVIIDSTGIIEFEEAKKINASKNFKMPLNYITISYVFKRLLPDASLEFQAIGQEILNEIKKFAKKQENGFIPFNAFTRVLMEQYKATPYKELRLLLARIKNCQMDEVFARTKKDVENLFKTIEKNPITIVDLSSVDFFWQKAYLEYIISDINQDIYLITRVNDENCDVDLITKIYSEKKNIKFVPNVSYTYKKLPTLLQYCNNYILMPTLYQRNDFLDANFALSNLISDGCIIFGENTDNFLYFVREYELETQEKRKNYRKIALTLAKNDEEETEKNLGQKGDYFENKESQKTPHSQRLMEELSNFEKEQKEQLQEKIDENFNTTISDEDVFDTLEEISQDKEEKENKEEENQSAAKEEIVFEAFEEIEETKQQEIKNDSQDEFQELKEPSKELEEPKESVTENKETEAKEEVSKKDDIIIQEEILHETIQEDTIQNMEETPQESFSDVLADETTNEAAIEETSKTVDVAQEATISIADVDLVDLSEENTKSANLEEPQNKESMEISDEELDFFQIAEESSFEENTENVIVDNVEYKTTNETQDATEEIDLSELADNSIDNNFEEIINTKNQDAVPTIDIDEETQLDLNSVKSTTEKENLPIFKEDLNDFIEKTYEEDDIVVHEKYGKGKVMRILPYQGSQFLEIEFENSGKKVLDPKRAKLKLAE